MVYKMAVANNGPRVTVSSKITNRIKLFYCFLLIIATSKANHNEQYDEIDVISGKELRVIIANIPPVTVIIRDANSSIIGFGGILYQQLDWMSKLLKINCNMMLAQEVTAGIKMKDGNWTGVIGQLTRGEADLACYPFALNMVRQEAIDYAAYIHGDAIGILVHYPKAEIYILGIVMPFSLNVWIGIALSIAAVIVSWYMIVKLKRKYFAGNTEVRIPFWNISDIFMHCIGTLSNQGMYYRAGHRSDVVLAVTWTFFAFVIINIYSSCLTSYTSLTYKRSEIGTFEDLANHPEYGLSTLKGSIMEISVLTAEKGPLKEIGNKFRGCGDECSLKDYDKILPKVIGDYHQAAILTTSLMRYMTTQSITNKSECRLTMGKEFTSYQHMYLAVPKNSQFVRELDQASLWWADLGLYDFWIGVESYGIKKCLLNYDYRGISYDLLPPNTRLQLKQFYLAFVVLLIGYLLAIFQFIRERIMGPL